MRNKAAKKISSDASKSVINRDNMPITKAPKIIQHDQIIRTVALGILIQTFIMHHQNY